MIRDAAPGEIVGSNKLDDLCKKVGNAFAENSGNKDIIEENFRADGNKVAIVCTGLYRYGGTSLLISDLIRANPGKECLVLATNFFEDMKQEDFEADRIGDTGSQFLVAPSNIATIKMQWLINQLVEAKPSRIFLLNHHQDSIIISTAQLFTEKSKVIFVHHADYNLCLGVHMSGAVHADIHNVGHCNCRLNEKISDNVYLPLVASDKKSNRAGDKFPDTDIITCSSGTAHKFLNFYLYPYTELIAQRLVERGGTHVHIGSLPDVNLSAIRKRLTEYGVEENRFVHIPWVKDLWLTLIEQRVDLFIGSFPIGGARTTLEVMGAGIPIMMHQSYLSRFYSSRDIVYPNHFVWKYPHQFIHLLKAINGEMLTAHSLRSRGHYLLNYCTESMDLAGEITRICDGSPIMVSPMLYTHDPDLLDRALHYSHLDHLARSESTNRVAGSGSVFSSTGTGWRNSLKAGVARLFSTK